MAFAFDFSAWNTFSQTVSRRFPFTIQVSAQMSPTQESISLPLTQSRKAVLTSSQPHSVKEACLIILIEFITVMKVSCSFSQRENNSIDYMKSISPGIQSFNDVKITLQLEAGYIRRKEVPMILIPLGSKPKSLMQTTILWYLYVFF